MKSRFPALACALLVFGSSCALFERHASQNISSAPPPVGTSERSVRTPDGFRRYLVHVPRSAPRRFLIPERYPLLILLHGSGEDGKLIEDMTQMDSVSELHHMMVAYPNGTRSILGKISADWNSGECCGYASRQHINDIAFLRAIIGDLAARGIVNQRRIYIAGFSSGAELAFRAGCELSDRVSAIAVVSGSIALGHCRPVLPVSLLAIQGTSDNEVPFDDDVPDSLDVPNLSWAENATPSVKYWSSIEGCTAERAAPLSAHVQRIDFIGCRGSQVELYTIAGGTHGWPDATPHDHQDQGDEAPMHELPASETIAEFLLRHRR